MISVVLSLSCSVVHIQLSGIRISPNKADLCSTSLFFFYWVTTSIIPKTMSPQGSHKKRKRDRKKYRTTGFFFFWKEPEIHWRYDFRQHTHIPESVMMFLVYWFLLSKVRICAILELAAQVGISQISINPGITQIVYSVSKVHSMWSWNVSHWKFNYFSSCLKHPFQWQ